MNVEKRRASEYTEKRVARRRDPAPEASGRSAGRAVARHLKTTWSCENEKVVLGSGGADRRDLDVVLTFLGQRRSDFTLDVGSAGELSPARTEEKPPVPEGLPAIEKRARE